MVEFVLVVPFLALLLGLTFFFGWVMTNKHEVILANRYSAWQRVLKGTWPDEEKLNQEFFRNEATSVSISGGGAVTQTVADLISEAGARGAQPEVLAEELFRRRFPGGRRAHVSANFTTDRDLWRRIMKDRATIRAAHEREGLTWRRDEVTCWGTLRDLYYDDLDAALQRIPPPAQRMAAMIRGLYLARW